MFKINIKYKIISVIAFIFFVISTYKANYYILCFYAIIGILLVFLFKPPVKVYFKKLFIVFLFPLSASLFIPFFNKGIKIFKINFYLFSLSITDNGLAMFYTILAKSFISIMVLVALTVSSKDLEIFHGLNKILLPRIMVSIIFLMYRYFFLIRDEVHSGQLAINSRIFQKSYLNVNKKLAFFAGSLFIKSVDRAENIYKSMESRGFTGSFEYYEEKENKYFKNDNISKNIFNDISNNISKSNNYLNIFFIAIFFILTIIIKIIELRFFKTGTILY